MNAISSRTGRLIAFALLALGLTVGYTCTTFDYSIILTDKLCLSNSPFGGHGLWLGNERGGSQIVDDVREYAIRNGLLIGRLGERSYRTGRQGWTGPRMSPDEYDRGNPATWPMTRDCGFDYGEGWFIIDTTWSDRLYEAKLTDANLVPAGYPPIAFFPLQQKQGWLDALNRFDVRTPVALKAPTRWQAKIWTPTWIAWGVILALWLPLYFLLRKRLG
jgi:hypothetical protein